jgi:phosphate transport system substrate-binding protein
MQNKMSYTGMINKDGKAVQPAAKAFAAAATSADWKGTPGYGVILANEPGAESWPMTAATFILVYKKPDDAAATGEALKFFSWAFAEGDKMADELAYIPMPDAVVKDIQALWSKEIVGADGKPVYKGS